MKFNYCIWPFVFVLLVSGCTKRYWYRTKIGSPHSKKHSVEIRIVNQSPAHLTQEFSNAMHKAAARVLKKYGYYETRVKSPQFVYTLVLMIDSNKQAVHFDETNIPTTLLLGEYNYRYGEARIVFKAQMDNPTYGSRWNKNFEMLFLGKERRDVFRSKGVTKRLIRISEQKRYQY